MSFVHCAEEVLRLGFSMWMGQKFGLGGLEAVEGGRWRKMALSFKRMTESLSLRMSELSRG